MPIDKTNWFWDGFLHPYLVRGKEIGTSFEVEGEGEEPWINLSQ